MKTYASITDLIQQEIAPVLATDDTLTPEQGDRIAREVCTRLQAAGLVVWEDGWSESRGAYWLPAHGFRMATDEDDDGAAFWAIVEDVLDAEGVDR